MSQLQSLLSGQLNQDWHADYDSVWDAIRDFAVRDPAAALAAEQEIRDLLDRALTEDELWSALDRDYDSEFYPQGVGLQPSEFLRLTAERLLADNPAGPSETHENA